MRALPLKRLQPDLPEQYSPAPCTTENAQTPPAFPSPCAHTPRLPRRQTNRPAPFYILHSEWLHQAHRTFVKLPDAAVNAGAHAPGQTDNRLRKLNYA